MKFREILVLALSFLIVASHLSAQQVLVPSAQESHDVVLLNGRWKFKYYPSSTEGKDSLFYNPDFSVKDWPIINTPGNWELQGFDEPVYGKKLKDAVGLYRTDFVVPAQWSANPVYLCFDGVSFGYTVWINGKYIGEYASSYNRKTFEVSSAIMPGKTNTLAVKVITHPKGWEFDTNDDWSLSGIIRDVTLFSLPSVHLRDLVVKTYVRPSSSIIVVEGSIEKTARASIASSLKIMGQLVDPSGKVVNSFAVPFDGRSSKSLLTNFERQIELTGAQLWSAEHPNLYKLRLSIYDDNTRLQEYTEHIGIREITWAGGVLKLNGSPIKLRGATHHDLSPVNGRSITGAEMLKDLKLMSEANINFLRTSHYPPQPRLLELCDSLGFYVMDEVPYGFGEEHLVDSSYLPILLQRAKATIERDKNHPCIIVWSVGNENPVTDIGLQTGRYVKALDRTRPYCFPQTPTEFEKMLKSVPDSLDLLDDHYAKAADLRRYVSTIDRPLILSEYAHALGLDFNDLDSIYETMMAHPKLAGGAVWEFFDQGLLRKAKKPVAIGDPTFYAWATPDSIYDTGENQGTDGIVYANRVPQVDYWQVRKVYSPVKALDKTLTYRPGKNAFAVQVINRYDFTNLSDVVCKWELFADRKVFATGRALMQGKPHDTSDLVINAVLPEKPTAAYYHLQLTFSNKQDYQFYEKSYLIKAIESDELVRQLATNAGKPTKSGDAVVSDVYRFEWSESGRDIVLKNQKGNAVIVGGPLARVGRKPTMAQEATTTSRRSKVRHTLWNPFLLKAKTSQIQKFDGKEVIVISGYAPDSLKDRSLLGRIDYRFSDSGYINISYSFLPRGNEEATETGISFLIPSSLSEFRWIGNGPYEAYPGKDKLSEFGFFHLTSNDLYFSGNRQNVRCAVFSDSTGNGFALVADDANIAVERTADGLLVSHNSSVSGRFNKYEWPEDLYSFKDAKPIKGSFTIVPLGANWPTELNNLFGAERKSANAFRPFYYSYDQ